jgi:O-antigen/teichoic acid export membrane protein
MSLLNYGFGLAASRVLNPGDFGLLAFAQSILLLSGFLLQSGVPWTLTRELVLAPLALRGALERGLESTPILAAVIVALPLIAIGSVARAAAQGISAFGRVGLIQGVEVTFKAVAGIALAVVGFGAIGAVAGFGVGALVAAAVGLAVIARRFPLIGRSIVWPRRATAGPMFGALLGLALILNLDLQAIKLLVGDRAVAGQYQAAIILANAPYFLVSSAIVPVLFTRLAHGGSLEATRRRVAEALRIGVALVLPFELLLIAVPDVVLGLLFPHAYAGAAPIVRLMAIGNAALILVVVLAAAFQAVDRAAEIGRVLLCIVAAEVVTLVLLVPRFGALGAVSSFDIAAISAALILGTRYASRVPFDRASTARWAAGLVASLAIAGAVAVVLRLATNPFLAVAGAGVIYYGLVIRAGLVPEIRLGDLGRLASAAVPVSWLRGPRLSGRGGTGQGRP